MMYTEDDFDWTQKVGGYNLLDNEDKKMKNGIGKLSIEDIKGALVSGVLYVGIAMAIEMSIYLLKVGDVFAVNWHDLLNATVLAGVAVVGSLLKNFLTTNSGNFVGAVKVK